MSVGFKEIRLTFTLSTVESQERIDALLKLTERYCVVFQTLAAGTSLRTTIAIR